MRQKRPPFRKFLLSLRHGWSGSLLTFRPLRRAHRRPPKGGPEAQLPAPGAPLDEFFRDFFGEKGAPGGANPSAPRVASLGSGFIIDPSGLIVTNNHVIANAEQITVTLSDDSTCMQAEVIGRDAVSDLALLKVRTKGTAASCERLGRFGKDEGRGLGARDRQSASGLGGTVTSGIISATARDIHSGPAYDDFLQTRRVDQPHGNSGGPMFNLAGEVIPASTRPFPHRLRAVPIGIGFAIPSAFARPIIDQLKATGKVERGWIGAHIQPVTEDIAEAVGLDKSRGAMMKSGRSIQRALRRWQNCNLET